MQKTIFLDIDGTILKHNGDIFSQALTPKLLPGVKEKFGEWIKNDYYIILTTGRPESYRDVTIQQLQFYAIPYDLLLMGLPRGPRVVINDQKPDSDVVMAEAFSLIRNEGLENVEA